MSDKANQKQSAKPAKSEARDPLNPSRSNDKSMEPSKPKNEPIAGKSEPCPESANREEPVDQLESDEENDCVMDDNDSVLEEQDYYSSSDEKSASGSDREGEPLRHRQAGIAVDDDSDDFDDIPDEDALFILTLLGIAMGGRLAELEDDQMDEAI